MAKAWAVPGTVWRQVWLECGWTVVGKWQIKVGWWTRKAVQGLRVSVGNLAVLSSAREGHRRALKMEWCDLTIKGHAACGEGLEGDRSEEASLEAFARILWETHWNIYSVFITYCYYLSYEVSSFLGSSYCYYPKLQFRNQSNEVGMETQGDEFSGLRQSASPSPLPLSRPSHHCLWLCVWVVSRILWLHSPWFSSKPYHLWIWALTTAKSLCIWCLNAGKPVFSMGKIFTSEILCQKMFTAEAWPSVCQAWR